MFDKEYSFRGTHAEKVIRLTAAFDKGGNKLFARNLDVYLLAPIVGFLYKTKAELDKTSSVSDKTTKIFPDTLIKFKDDLLFNYRLIVLLDKAHESDFEKRVNKAFRYYGSSEAFEDEQLFESYVRGGVDKIYEKIFETGDTTTDYLKNLFLFTEEIEMRYNSEVDKDEFFDLCALARN